MPTDGVRVAGPAAEPDNPENPFVPLLPRSLLALCCAAIVASFSIGSAQAAPAGTPSSRAEVANGSSKGKDGADDGTSKRERKQEQKRGAEIVARARQYEGTPYRWGGSSPAGFDCSGFTMYIYGQFDVKLPRDLGGQLESGRRIDRDDLIPGDLLIFQNTYRRGISHGGIYIGEGRFIHAVDESTGVVISSLGSNYWASRYYGASRPGR